MNKCRRNAARKRRGNCDGPVKLTVRRYSSERVERLMKMIRMEIGQ